MTVITRERVIRDWIDYNGHLSEPYYVLVFGHATDAVMDRIGLDALHRERHGTSLYTLEAHVRYLAEVGVDADLEVRSTVIGASSKLLWIWHEMWCEDRLRATEEVLGVHVDASAGHSTAFPDEVAAQIAALRTEPPAAASRRIELPDR